MKLVILVDSVFSERDYIRFGVENMIAKGMEVCLWDFSAIWCQAKFYKVGVIRHVRINKYNLIKRFISIIIQ